MNVTQFHFTAWPDHGVPDYTTSLLAFHKRLKKHNKSSKGSVLVGPAREGKGGGYSRHHHPPPYSKNEDGPESGEYLTQQFLC